MSKLSHSNPNLDDVLHEGNAHKALGKEIAPEDEICPEDHFDDHELSVIAFMAKQQDLKYRELTGQQMQDLLSEYEDCEEWKMTYMCS